MKIVAVLVLALSLLGPAAGARAASTATCGTLSAMQWPNALTGTPGRVTVAGQTYTLNLRSWSDGTSVITRAVAVGAQVCLSGESVPDAADLITNFRLDGCPACVAEDVLPVVGGLSSWLFWPLVLLALGASACVATVQRGRPRSTRRAHTLRFVS